MKTLLWLLVIIVVVAVVGGVVYLEFWSDPPQRTPVEQVIPNERSAR